MKVLDKQEKYTYFKNSSLFKFSHEEELCKRYEVCQLDGIDVFWTKQGIKKTFYYDDERDSPLTENESQRHDFFIRENMTEANNWDFDRWKAFSEGKKYDVETSYWRSFYNRVRKPYLQIFERNNERYAEPVFWGDEMQIAIEENAHRNCSPLFRELTEPEIEFLGACSERFLAEYKKRLETYWKKYSHLIEAIGYWANR